VRVRVRVRVRVCVCVCVCVWRYFGTNQVQVFVAHSGDNGSSKGGPTAETWLELEAEMGCLGCEYRV